MKNCKPDSKPRVAKPPKPAKVRALCRERLVPADTEGVRPGAKPAGATRSPGCRRARRSGRFRPEDILPPFDRSTGLVGRVKLWHVFLVAGIRCLPWGFYFALLAPYLMPVFVAPVMLVMAVVVWALPDLPRAPTRSMTLLFFAFFIALIAWPSYLAIALPGMPWITAIRLASFPMVLFLAISLSTSQQFRAELYDSLNAAPALWKAVIILTVLQLLSIPMSKEIGLSVQKYVVALVSWTAIFFVSAWVFRKPGLAVRWAATMWGLAVFVTLIAVVEYKEQRVLWAGHIPSFLAIQDDTVNRILGGASHWLIAPKAPSRHPSAFRNISRSPCPSSSSSSPAALLSWFAA